MELEYNVLWRDDWNVLSLCESANPTAFNCSVGINSVKYNKLYVPNSQVLPEYISRNVSGSVDLRVSHMRLRGQFGPVLAYFEPNWAYFGSVLAYFEPN